MRKSEPSSPPLPLVVLRSRQDGWTAARQQQFLQALSQTRSVARAAAAVGLSRHSAYRLRQRPEAVAFRAAWDDVFAQALVPARKVARRSPWSLSEGSLLRALSRLARLDKDMG
jgi:hypothetical protein